MKSLLLFCILGGAALPLLAEDALPPPWKHQDLGAVVTPGKATVSSSGAFVVEGSLDLWGPADGCHLVSRPMKGDGECIARIASMENPGAVAHAKGSLCLRESLEPGAKEVVLSVTASDGVQFLYRETTGGKMARVKLEPPSNDQAVVKGHFPCWLKLVRHGDTVSGYESSNGLTWQMSGEIHWELPADAFLALAASSHKPDVLTKVTFDHISAPP